MTMRKMAALPGGGFVLQPPIEQDEAEKILGQIIPPEAWCEIRAAFGAFGRRERALEASKASRSKGDPQSWQGRQDSAVKAIEAAMGKVRDAKGRHGEFLREASELYNLQRFGCTLNASFNARRLLEEAHDKLIHAAAIIERAEAMEIETPTKATSRDMLVREIHTALTAHGIEARASTGYALDGTVGPVLMRDLTPFEQLIDAFGIGDERTEAAFSAFVRAAIAGEKQG